MNQRDLLEYLQKDNEFHSITEIRQAFNCHQSRVYMKLFYLTRYGLVEKEVRPNRNGGKLTYWRAVE